MNAIAPTKTGASLNRHKSNQNRGTPRVFLDAVEQKFGPIAWDLAASASNAVATKYFGPDHENESYRDSLVQDWGSLKGVCFLNPPFANIAPWAAKCASVKHRRGWTLFLVPDSRDSNWYIQHVAGQCIEIPLSGRIVFNGEKTGFPKSLVLYCYGFGVAGAMPAWRWNTEKRWRLAPKVGKAKP